MTLIEPPLRLGKKSLAKFFACIASKLKFDLGCRYIMKIGNTYQEKECHLNIIAGK
jgi:hypothetical protein